MLPANSDGLKSKLELIQNTDDTAPQMGEWELTWQRHRTGSHVWSEDTRTLGHSRRACPGVPPSGAASAPGWSPSAAQWASPAPRAVPSAPSAGSSPPHSCPSSSLPTSSPPATAERLLYCTTSSRHDCSKLMTAHTSYITSTSFCLRPEGSEL